MKPISLLTTEWVSEFVNIANANSGKVERIEFNERRYLEKPYNTDEQRILLLFSRQTEKCLVKTQRVVLGNGKLVPASEITTSDNLMSLHNDQRLRPQDVSWVSRTLRKECVRITTARGHILEVAKSHPIRTWEAWTPAGELRVRDRVAAVQAGGQFTGKARPSAERIRLTAVLVGDGGLTQPPTIGFSSDRRGPWVDELLADVETLGGTYRKYDKPDSAHGVDVRINKLPVLLTWLREDGLLGKHSPDKCLPGWVFDLRRGDTALFLNRLWATDGHTSLPKPTNYDISYSSTSRVLAEQVQSLLWKFEIPSAIRRQWPAVYKRKGIRKYAYAVCVQTQEGYLRFLENVGAFGKSENVPIPTWEENNNRDTFPKGGVQDIIHSATGGTHGGIPAKYKLNRTLGFAPGRDKLRRYAKALRDLGHTEQGHRLQQHADGGVFWDVIKSIEDIGEQECVDFTVTDTHNFVCGGVITHNSTSTGNKLIALSNMRSFYNSLFVTPSALQTTGFSKTRIDDIVKISPFLRSMRHQSMSWNLLEKQWLNGSKIFLRYAFLSADRIRGLSVNAIFIDEIQDILRDVVPVIEETSSHNKNRIFVYSGTPKTFDNTIHTYWEDHSTQGEWVIPCEHHGTPKDPSSWHWNILDSENIGKTGPICSKCKNLINPEHPEARWVEMNPGAQFQGFRVCRLMVPWYVKDPKSWASILDDQKRYPRAQFENEVMARSYDSGTKPITKGELYRLCDSKYLMTEEQTAELALQHRLWGGIDWGSDGQAYTLMTVGGYVRGDYGYQIVFAKRFEGHLRDPKPQLMEIIRLIDLFRLARVGTDYGMGHWPNKLLTTKYGPTRIFPFMHAERLSSKIKYSPQLGRHVLYRSPVMGDVFSAMKLGKIRFPAKEMFDRPFITDISNITSEYSSTLKMLKYDKPRGVTDDTMHSLLYCLLASNFDQPRPDIFIPMKEAGHETGAAMDEFNAIERVERELPEESLMEEYDPFGDMY